MYSRPTTTLSQVRLTQDPSATKRPARKASYVLRRGKPLAKHAEKSDTHLRIDTKLNNVYNAIGLKRNLTGTVYLSTAIRLLVEHHTVLVQGLTSELYPTIALLYHKNAACVERAIRNAIRKCCQHNAGALNSYFHTVSYSADNMPTNAEFIALLYDDVMLDLRNRRDPQ